jgi:cell division protease FtsH
MPSSNLRVRRTLAAALICVVALLAGAQSAFAGRTVGQKPARPESTHSSARMSYGQLLTAIDRNQVKAAAISETSGQVTVTLRSGAKFDVAAPADDTSLAPRLHRAGADVTFTTAETANGRSAPVWMVVVPVALMIGIGGFVIYMTRRQTHLGRRGRAQAEARNAAADAAVPSTRFSDVAGCDEAVEELREMLDFLTNPEKYERVKATLPSGAILHGGPGTGKTLLARALAGESGLPIYQASGSEFVEMYVGLGAKRIRELFAKARRTGGVVFIDEIDAIGRRRGGNHGAGNEEREATLNQLLTELDGFTPRDNIIVLAATNMLEVLDPALVRPGRLAHQILVEAPSLEGRRRLFELYLGDKPLADDVDVDRLAGETAGCTGAQIADMANRAAIYCVRQGREEITMADLDEGHMWALMGPEKKDSSLADGELEKIAYHEAGHVVTAEHCDTHEKSQRVTIKPRGRAGGFAKYAQRDRMLHDLQIVHEELVCLLGGRAAEREVFGVVSSGAQNDLQRVTMIARHAVEELALAETFGQVLTAGDKPSDEVRRRVDAEIERLVADAYQDAQRIVAQHRAELDTLAAALVEQKELYRVDIVAALAAARGERGSVPAARPRRVAQAPRPRPHTDHDERAVAPARIRRPRQRRAGKLVAAAMMKLTRRTAAQQA